MTLRINPVFGGKRKPTNTRSSSNNNGNRNIGSRRRNASVGTNPNNNKSGSPARGVRPLSFGVGRNASRQFLNGSPRRSNPTMGQGFLDISNPQRYEISPLLPFKNMFDRTGNQSFNPNNFIEMMDRNSRRSLGVWPRGVKPENLRSGLRTYHGGSLIFPMSGTPGIGMENNHNGIDIFAPPGTPIYAPADGVIEYSENGHTRNNGKSETQYSVRIRLDEPIKYTGSWTDGNRSGEVNYIYLTHMCGITNRVPEGSGELEVKKGDIIGYSGVANDANHLHMTFYEDDTWTAGVTTQGIKEIYGLDGSSKKAGE